MIKLNILVLALLSLCSGCGTEQGNLFFPPEALLSWPALPETPRIRYVGSLSTESDLKKKVPWTQGFSELFFGKKDIGILICPYSLGVDSENRLFVADSDGAVVHMFDLNTREYRQFSEMANQEKLSKPVGLEIVEDRIYVVDSRLHKVCVFDKRGTFKFSFGHDYLERPTGIAYRPDDKTVYVTDTASHTVNVFSINGKLIHQIGSRGINPGQFNFPTHLWIDTNGKLYVSDTLNYRIQVFSRNWQYLNDFGRQGDRPGNFAHPSGVATDSYGNIYVTDRQFENVQLFDRSGQLLMAFGEEGTQPGCFWLPAGIFIDDKNRIFVADSFNKRIQIFKLLEQVNK